MNQGTDMARTKSAVPRYCRHKASQQAVVRLDGIDHYLGPFGSPESHEAYERAIAEWRVQRLEHVGAEQAPTGKSYPACSSAEQSRGARLDEPHSHFSPIIDPRVE